MTLDPLTFTNLQDFQEALKEEGLNRGWKPFFDVKDVIDNILEHHGIKGQKWGVRRTKTRLSEARAQRKSSDVTVIDKNKRIKTRGGKGLPAHPDAIRARTLGQKGKGSGLKSLSDAELQAYAKRLQLEQSVKRLNYNEKPAAIRLVNTILGRSGTTAVQETTKQVATQKVKKTFIKAGVLAVAG